MAQGNQDPDLVWKLSSDTHFVIQRHTGAAIGWLRAANTQNLYFFSKNLRVPPTDFFKSIENQKEVVIFKIPRSHFVTIATSFGFSIRLKKSVGGDP